MSDWIIDVEGLAREYAMGASTVQALRGVDMQVGAGEFIAIMGTSGSGKSTLLHLLGCLDTPTAGRYRLEGQDVQTLSADQRARVRSRRIGFVFQTFNLLHRLRAAENVALPLYYQGRVPDVDEKAMAALARVGLAGRAGHRPSEMSGGEQQRVAIARALVTDPALILADEPTGNLDSATSREIMALLSTLGEEGRTIVMVTHDPLTAERAGRVLRMSDGRFVEE